MPSYRALKGIRAALANVSVAVVLADGGAVVPATVAALALGSLDGNGELLALGQFNSGDDENSARSTALSPVSSAYISAGTTALTRTCWLLVKVPAERASSRGLGHGATELE